MTDAIRLQEAREEGYNDAFNDIPRNPSESEEWYVVCYEEGYNEGINDRREHYEE